jgi:hypothetical protein
LTVFSQGELSQRLGVAVTPTAERRLARVLGLDERRKDDADEALAEFQRACIQEVVDWIVGRRRPESLAALERARLIEIFKIRRSAPSAQFLGDELGFTEARATATLSRLKYGAARLIRGYRLRELAEAVASAGGATKAGEERLFQTAVSRELYGLAQRMTAEGKKLDDDIKIERAAQYGLKWRLKATDWTKFGNWLKETGDAEIERAAEFE